MTLLRPIHDEAIHMFFHSLPGEFDLKFWRRTETYVKSGINSSSVGVHKRSKARFSSCGMAYVSSGCHDKIPSMGSLIQQTVVVILTVLETRSTVWCTSMVELWWPHLPRLQTVNFFSPSMQQRVQASSPAFLIRAPIPFRKTPPS